MERHGEALSVVCVELQRALFQICSCNSTPSPLRPLILNTYVVSIQKDIQMLRQGERKMIHLHVSLSILS